jgi:hypothetical protein
MTVERYAARIVELMEENIYSSDRKLWQGCMVADGGSEIMKMPDLKYSAEEEGRFKEAMRDLGMVRIDYIWKLGVGNKIEEEYKATDGQKISASVPKDRARITPKSKRKMTIERAREIRVRAMENGKSLSELVEEFGVNYHTLRDIVEGRTWKEKE